MASTSGAMISRILVPVDFSRRCQDAVRYAAALACRFQSELTLLHVFVEPWAAYSSPEGYATPPPYDLESTLAQVKRELDSFVAEDLRRFRVERVLEEGDPAEAIARVASRGFDLVVMPTRGYGPFRRLLLGSVTAKVLHDVTCPVFTGPHLEHPPDLQSPHFYKVLCSLDFGPQSRKVLEWAARFAREFGSELAVVHALCTSPARLDGIYFDSQIFADLAATARRQAAQLLDEMDVKAEILVELGDEPEAVRAAAESAHADLVVIGREHGHKGLGRLRMHAYGTVRESPCPVVAV